MSLEIGSTFSNRYEINEEIGIGGTALVYKAYDLINKKNVALKYFKEEIDEQSSVFEHFKQECIILASLHHPNIINVFDSGSLNKHPYLVSEIVEGKTLKEVLDRRSYLPINEAIDLMIQIIDTLSYAHSHNVIHRDIKPHNIFIMIDGSIKLGDFGISEAKNLGKVKDEKVLGTVQYVCPELISSKEITNRSDIYSLGIVFYEMITGRVPFDEDTASKTALAHLNKEFPSVRKYMPSCPGEIEKIIFKATKKNPKDRFDSVDDFKKSLIKFQNKKKIFARLRGVNK